MPLPAVKPWLQASLLGAVATLTAYIVAVADMPALVQVLSRAAGIWLAVLIIFGLRFWPVIAFWALMLGLWQTGSPWAAVFMAVLAVAQAWLGAWFLARCRFDPELRELRQVLFLSIAALVPPLLGVAARMAAQFSGWSFPWVMDEWAFWRADALSVLFIAPTIFAWCSWPRLGRDWKKPVESAALFVLLGLGCWATFASFPPGTTRGFLLVPLGMWAAMRFGLRTITTMNLVVAVCAFLGTVRGLGQLGSGTLHDRMILLTAFLFVAAFMNLIFFAAFSERIEARNTRERLAQILENTTDLVGMADVNGQVTFVNQAGRRLMGIPPDADVTRMRIADFHPPWAAEKVAQEAIPAAIQRGAWSGETALRTLDGRELAISQVVLAHSHNGRVAFLSTIARDITEDKRAENELRLSEERFSKAFRGTPDWITISTVKEGRYVEVNDAFLRGAGYARDEVIGRTTFELQIWHDPTERARMLEMLQRDGHIENMEIRFHERSGRVILGLLSADVIEVGGENCLLSVVRDITRARHLEDQLRQAQKMEAVGRLAAGIAHDFNNLLLVIHGYTELQLDSMSADDPGRKGMEEVKHAADRAAALTRQLLAFSRKQVLEPKVLDLNAIVTDVSKLLGRLIGAHVALETILDPRLGRVKADPSQVEQILINLAVNARDAMPDGGRITVETANVILDESFSENRPEIIPGKYVMIAVSDTGVGMDSETRARIFEPFFTTKERDKGTGLGLATVYGVVKQSNGYIYVYSEPGHGATFKVFLPQVEEQIVTGGPLPSVDHSRGHEFILLVEDEEGVRNLARDFLGLKGYKVLAAPSGIEALKLMEAYSGPVDLLLTDIVMPGVGGRQLASTMRQRWPQMQVLFISGYTDDTVLRAGTLVSGEVFLQKPFALTTLATRVREVLSGKASTAAGD